MVLIEKFTYMQKPKRDIREIVVLELEGVAKLLEPIIYKIENHYCCETFEDQTKLEGCGYTPQDAVSNWDKNLQKHLASAGTDDPIVKLALSKIHRNEKTSRDKTVVSDHRRLEKKYEDHIDSIEDPDTAKQVRAFYEQFILFERKSWI